MCRTLSCFGHVGGGVAMGLGKIWFSLSSLAASFGWIGADKSSGLN